MMDQNTLLMHQVMLGDQRRLDCYDKALAQSIRPGDVVLDVGAGLLVLSMLALRNGASHVYAVEGNPAVAAVAQSIAEENRLHGKLTLIQGDARSVRLPRKADVIVSEMMGNLGPEEQMSEVLAEVAAHNLRSGGRVVPLRLETCLQALALDAEGWGVWRDGFCGYSFEAVQRCVAPGAQLHFFSRPPTLLSGPVVVSNVELGEKPAVVAGTHYLPVSTAGRLHVIAGYFRVTLADGIELSNFPGYPGCNWAVWVWPVRHCFVKPNDIIWVEIRPPADYRDAGSWRLDCSIALAEAL